MYTFFMKEKAVSIHDVYHIYDGEDVIPGLALMVALERIMTERREAGARHTSTAGHGD